jgi:hypothetical protein
MAITRISAVWLTTWRHADAGDSSVLPKHVLYRLFRQEGPLGHYKGGHQADAHFQPVQQVFLPLYQTLPGAVSLKVHLVQLLTRLRSECDEQTGDRQLFCE